MQICVWSTGNAARPIVQAISEQIFEQKATMEGRNPATTKLAVDPFLRIEGALDAIALGDCSRMAGRPLPATAQVCALSVPARAHLSRPSIPLTTHAAMRVCGMYTACLRMFLLYRSLCNAEGHRYILPLCSARLVPL